MQPGDLSVILPEIVLSLFAIMSGVTIILGAKDVRKLLQDFEADAGEQHVGDEPATER